MVKELVTGVALGVTGLVLKLHSEAAGNPLHFSETGLGKVAPCGTGDTVAVYVTDWPSVTLALAGVTATEKSFTVVLAPAELLPAFGSLELVLTEPLSARGPVAFPDNPMVIVALAPTAICPRLHTTVSGVPAGAAQLPRLALEDW